MSVLPLRADLDYLRPPPGAWWRWTADNGGFIEWTDGRTIAAREELRLVLERLAPRGLPPIGAVLLLMAATRQNWDAAKAKALIVQSAAQLDPGGAESMLDGVVRRRLEADVADVLDDLAAIAALAKPLREPIRSKTALADYLFLDGVTSIGPAAAEGVVALLGNGFDAAFAEPPDSTIDAARRTDLELSALRPGLARIQIADVDAILKTGLDLDLKSAELELPLGKRVRSLLAELREDVDLGAVARIATQLLAVLHVPRSLRSQEELPLGGVSDISNRGSFDRLLISELAHDPETLAVRVAMNEALYLRRETPARHPPILRAILVDSGIRTWGVPRLYACGIAMALAATHERADGCVVLRSDGRRVQVSDLSTRAGVQAHLAHLSPWPDVADAILAFVDGLDDPSAACELFVVVDRSTVDDDAFWRRLDGIRDGVTLYVAIVARDGTFELLLRTRQGRRRVASARLDLIQLIAGSPKAAKRSAERLTTRDPSLPLILCMRRFPIRLPARVDPTLASTSAAHGLIGVTADRQLMQWMGEKVGAQVLLDHLPAGRVRRVLIDQAAEVCHVVLTRKKASMLALVTLNLSSGHHRVQEFRVAPPVDVVLHRGVPLVLHRRSFLVLNPAGGTLREFALPHDTRPHGGRFYAVADGLIAAAENGPVRARESSRIGEFAFDRGDGPWTYGPGPTFFSADLSASVRLEMTGEDRKRIFKSLIASDDGDRVLLVDQTSTDRNHNVIAVDLRTNPATFTRVLGNHAAYAFLLGDAGRGALSAGMNARHQFANIAVNRSGQLVLWQKRRFTLGFNESGQLRLIESARDDGDMLHTKVFGPPVKLPDVAWTLRQASWSDGSRAWLDSRGLLHLRSSRPTLPEMSLVLTDTGVTGGWTSDGQTFGWRFFVLAGGDAKPSMTDAQAEGLLRAFAEGLR